MSTETKSYIQVDAETGKDKLTWYTSSVLRYYNYWLLSLSYLSSLRTLLTNCGIYHGKLRHMCPEPMNMVCGQLSPYIYLPKYELMKMMK